MKLTFDTAAAAPMEPQLAHHDLVFRAPVCDPTYGLPIGNGDSGALLWFDEDTLHVQLNHTDLVDDLDTDTRGYCAGHDEKNTVGINGARLDVRFGCPVFGTIYQNTFEARLRLADATALIHADTPFGVLHAEALSSRAWGCTVLTLDGDWTEPQMTDLSLARFGSRTFAYWYSHFMGRADIGTSGTDAFAEADAFGVTQTLHGRAFCVAAKVLDGSDGSWTLRRRNSHMAEAGTDARSAYRLTCLMTVAVAETADAAKRGALARLEAAAKCGRGAIYQAHAEEWGGFWSKSRVVLPEDQDYPENLWYLNLYYANCQMRGAYPAHFCNGVWGFYHDFVPWNYYFHYNGQLATFPLEAANHPELTETYYRFRRGQLEIARKYAAEIKQGKGAFYTDVSDLTGRMDRSVSDNCTCGAQIAMGMVQHYRYTGDEAFLRETALPVLRGVGEYYLDKLREGDDGRLHILQTQGYEGSPLWDDSITDLSMIRAVFGALTELLPAEDAAPYASALDRLTDFEPADFLPGELAEDGTIARGIGKGLVPRDERVLSIGRDGNGQRMRRTFADPANDYYGFPDTEMAPLFPAGLTGLGDRDSALFRRIYNSVCMHHEVSFPADHPDRPGEWCMGWCMMPIYLARMGLSDLLVKQIGQTIEGWMRFPQGFGLYTPSDRAVIAERFRQYRLNAEDIGEQRQVNSWNYRHFDYETLPILASAINEMLLQSYDGILRLFPAVRETERYAFRLAASGGFSVDAVFDRGTCSARIVSTRGGTLRLTAEHLRAPLTLTDADGSPLPAAECGGVWTVETVPGQTVVAVSGGASFDREYLLNNDQKTCGTASLGYGREYGD